MGGEGFKIFGRHHSEDIRYQTNVKGSKESKGISTYIRPVITATDVFFARRAKPDTGTLLHDTLAWHSCSSRA